MIEVEFDCWLVLVVVYIDLNEFWIRHKLIDDEIVLMHKYRYRMDSKIIYNNRRKTEIATE